MATKIQSRTYAVNAAIGANTRKTLAARCRAQLALSRGRKDFAAMRQELARHLNILTGRMAGNVDRCAIEATITVHAALIGVDKGLMAAAPHNTREDGIVLNDDPR